MSELLSKAEFARRAGVSRASVTKACNGDLGGAIVGRRIDVNHPAAQSYLQKHDNPSIVKTKELRQKTGRNGYVTGNRESKTQKVKGITPKKAKSENEEASLSKTPENEKQTPPARASVVPPDDHNDIPESLLPYLDYSLLQLIKKFGSDVAFLDWLKAVKIIEDIEEKRLRNSERRGELVSRPLMKKGVIDVVNETHLRMLTDGAKSIANDAMAMALSGSDQQKVERAVEKRLSKFIKPCKARMTRAIKNV